MKTLLLISAITFSVFNTFSASAQHSCCKQGNHMSCGNPPLHCDDDETIPDTGSTEDTCPRYEKPARSPDGQLFCIPEIH